MRHYLVNPLGEKLYELECRNFECKYDPMKATIIHLWLKEYNEESKQICEFCGNILIETSRNFSPSPPNTKEE